MSRSAERREALSSQAPRKSPRGDAERVTAGNVFAALNDQVHAYAMYGAMARLAKKGGLLVVAQVLLETAEQEMTHAEVLTEALGPKALSEAAEDFAPPPQAARAPSARGTCDAPASCEGCEFSLQDDTVESLQMAIAGEVEDRDGYKKFAATARRAKTPGLGNLFDNLATAENYHRARFEVLLNMVTEKYLDHVGWRCANCGWISPAGEEPAECRVCMAKKGCFWPLNFGAVIAARL